MFHYPFVPEYTLPDNPLIEAQHNYIANFIKLDDSVAIEKLLQEGIPNLSDDPGSIIQLDQGIHISIDSRNQNLLQYAVVWTAVKCVELLVNAPYTWNVDLPDERRWSSMHSAEVHENPEIMVIMAPFSAQIRPSEAEFMFTTGANYLQYSSIYLLWPHVALLDQPKCMLPHLRRVTKGTVYTIDETSIKYGINELFIAYRTECLSLLCEILLANAELVNLDVTLNKRLPYKSIVNVDSSRMWPIIPISNDFMDEHIRCSTYPRCMKHSYPVHFDTWKFHRFSRVETDKKDAASMIFIWGPPTLKEFCRLIIRRLMVRRVEPLNNNSEEYMHPNQAILIKYVPLPETLKEYMLFTDIPKSRNWDVEFGFGLWKLDVERADVPRYGPGSSLRKSFVPDSFKSFYP